MKKLFMLVLTLVIFVGLIAEQGFAQEQQRVENSVTTQAVQNIEFKDPGSAALYSVACPGCGQMYAGDIGRGLAIMGVSVGAPLFGGIITGSSCDTQGCSSAPAVLGLLVGAVAWGFGVYDAGPTASRMNAARGFALTSGHELGEFILSYSIPIGSAGR